jgi:hypothetical protein
MTDPSTPPDPATERPVATTTAALLSGRFAGRVAFAGLVRDAFRVAAAEGWQTITVADPDFADWPLGEREVAQCLNDWARSGRSFVMLAGSYDEVVRRHARFVTWRRTWAHLVDCRATAAMRSEDLPSALWSPGWVFERLHLQKCTGTAGGEAARRLGLRERLAEPLRRSTPSFAAHTLGL